MNQLRTQSKRVASALVLGLLLAETAQAQVMEGVACLSGDQETPPNASPGTGTGTFLLDVGAGTLTFDISYSGLLGAPTVAHFHLGDCGVLGGVAVGVSSASPITGTTPLTASQVSAAMAGDLYINVHSSMFGGGEIRGNLDFDGASSCIPCAQATQSVRLGTPPNPSAFLPGSSGAVVGASWDPVIDHTSFVPAAITDFALVTTGALNLPLGPQGTLLCNIATNPLVLVGAPGPGVAFDIPVPPNAALVGLDLCAQGGSIDGAFAAHLANAIDLVVGTF